MKRIGGVLCLAVLIVTMTASICFGGESLKVVDSYPKDKQKNTTTENMGVKLWFNNDMGNKETIKANEKCFQIVDDEGKKLPVKVFYSPKDKKEVMVLLDANKRVRIKDNTKYTLKINGALQDSNGNKLGKSQTISFTTLNEKKNRNVYMVMMAIMFIGMFVFSSRQMKKQMSDQNQVATAKEEPFNPYKEAKKQGKTVEEVIAQHEKEVAKKEAKEARKAAHRHDVEEDLEEEEEDNGNYRVKGPRPIAACGSTYITGRKAEAEARKAEEERLEKRRAANKKKKKK